MGGASIFRVKKGDPNISVIIETLTAHSEQYAMIQAFIPDISNGDKRILIVDGEPMPYTLARIPAKGETRGNLAAEGRGEARPLRDTEWKIANAIGPKLTEKGIIFVGVDVIGECVTEINVTRPRRIREMEGDFDISITGQRCDAMAKPNTPKVTHK